MKSDKHAMTALNSERLKQRVHGRAQAAIVLDLVDLPHAQCVEAFLDELRCRLTPESVSDAKVAVDQQSLRELSVIELQFGKYAGSTYGQVEDVDRDYLEWLCESQRQSADTLGTFLTLTRTTHEGY